MGKKIPLRLKYAAICDEYAKTLTERWETDGWWIGDLYQTFCVADCYISNFVLRVCVNENVDWDVFYAWYRYDEQIRYGESLGKDDAIPIDIEQWILGFPEERKVPAKVREAWEKEYWSHLNDE